MRDGTSAGIVFSPAQMKNLIRLILEQRGWSLRQLARESGVSVARLSYWMTKGESIDEIGTFICTLKRVSNKPWSKFGKEMDRLLGGSK